MRDKAWAALKNLKKGSKDIVELAGEVEKLAKRLHPREEEAVERHAVDAFLGALDQTFAAEVQKLRHRTMEEVVVTARRIEKILEEQTDSKMERLVNTMQDQIRILKKDLKEAHEQIAAHKIAATPVSILATVPAPTVAATQPPPPVPAPARHLFQEYPEEPPFYHPPRRQMDRRPHAASSVERKDISSPTVRPVQSSSASSASKSTPALASCLEDKYWSYLSPRTTPKLTQTYS